jgi:hypothetical protein
MQTQTTTVIAEADVSLQLGEVFGVVYAGEPFFVSVQMSNMGPSPATGVTATLRIPHHIHPGSLRAWVSGVSRGTWRMLSMGGGGWRWVAVGGPRHAAPQPGKPIPRPGVTILRGGRLGDATQWSHRPDASRNRAEI